MDDMNKPGRESEMSVELALADTATESLASVVARLYSRLEVVIREDRPAPKESSELVGLTERAHRIRKIRMAIEDDVDKLNTLISLIEV
jgi:hypothetical protein